MEHYCKVVMLGRATADPVARDRDRATLGFVYNDRFKAGREWIDHACYIDCEAAGELCEYVMRAVRKGYLLMIEGRLRLEEWTDSEKKRHRKHKVILTEVRVMQRPKGSTPAPPATAPAPAQNSEPQLFDGEPEPI